MLIIDADKFLAYLIFSKHIDGLTCGEVKKAVEMCKVDVIEKIKSEIETVLSHFCFDDWGNETTEWKEVKAIIDKYRAESEVRDADID